MQQQIGNAYWSVPAEELLSSLETTPNGLSAAEAALRLKATGPNALIVSRRVSSFGLLISQFKNPLVLILLFAVAISLFAGEWVDAGVIFVIVVGSALITFAQEYSASNAVAKLRARLTHNVTALRDGQQQSVPVETIVPGDIVMLSAGSLIAADGVVLETKDFFVNQAILTGETFPTVRQCGVVPETAGLSERTNCVYMGTSAGSGTARVLVVQTGANTEYGEIADKLSVRQPETEFERGIRTFGVMLSQIMVLLILVVFAINVVSAKPPIDSLLFAIALAVGISPELLPVIITMNLSKGAREMARQGVIVRRLNAIENLGSMDVLCTDKTGTLTLGVVKLDGAMDSAGKPSKEVFRLAYLNASLQTGLANPLDEAIKSSETLDISGVCKIDEVPYDFVRKRLTVVVREGGQPPFLITKGALDNVLSVCREVRAGDGVLPLDKTQTDRLDEQFSRWSEQGFRVLGLAVRSLSNQKAISREDERDMTFTGFLLFFDPPKPDVQSAIEDLAKLGVELKIITGDNRRVAMHIAETVGLKVENVLTGAELNNLRDEALWHLVEHTTLFAEVDPNQKERIIRALKRMGRVVGYMGDGINDAPALHDADVGISVDTAVDVAREAADFVLLKHDLSVLRSGIEEGRVTFANSLKYIFTTTSANFGNMFSMAAASIFLPFLPLLAKQILLNNFLSDFPAMAIASDNVDRELVEKPHRWDVKFIRNFMVVFGLISSIFDMLTFACLLLWLHTPEKEFQTGWFIESLLTELFVALIVRTRRPLFKSRPGRWLLISTIAVTALTLALPYLPYHELLGFVPLPASVVALIVTITLLYVAATEAVKLIFFRRLAGTA